jgi:hypothetical protein
MNDTQWLYPLLVAAFLAAFGWLLRNAWMSVEQKIDDLEASFARITSDIVRQHAAMEERLQSIDKRLVRIESWKELFTLPDMQGRSRRVTDRLSEHQLREEDR